jgi:hypothetical protein
MASQEPALNHKKIVNGKILLHAHPLLGNVLVKKFPQRKIFGKFSVARSRTKSGSCFSVSAVTSQQLIVITRHVFFVDPIDPQ